MALGHRRTPGSSVNAGVMSQLFAWNNERRWTIEQRAAATSRRTSTAVLGGSWDWRGPRMARPRQSLARSRLRRSPDLEQRHGASVRSRRALSLTRLGPGRPTRFGVSLSTERRCCRPAGVPEPRQTFEDGPGAVGLSVRGKLIRRAPGARRGKRGPRERSGPGGRIRNVERSSTG